MASSSLRREFVAGFAILLGMAGMASLDIVSAKGKARCYDNWYPKCYEYSAECPPSCPDRCQMDCKTCKPVCPCDQPGGVCQDPRFIGGDGITFYFHGKRDQDFCLLTDPNLHINAHFIGKSRQGMNRDFTWVQAIGILFRAQNTDTSKALYVGAKKASTWEDSTEHLEISLDGNTVPLPDYDGAVATLPSLDLKITRLGRTNAVRLEAENLFQITATVVLITEQESRIHNYGITKDDCFAHLELKFKFFSLTPFVNGVLGKTYSADYESPVKMLGSAMPVMGGEPTYVTSGIFSTDCKVSRFAGYGAPKGLELGDLSESFCGSGRLGRGIVCRR